MIDLSQGLALWFLAGPYAPAVAPEALAPTFALDSPAMRGVEFGWSDTTFALDELGDVTTSGTSGDLRLYSDSLGRLQVDRLSLESSLLSIRSRPLLGDSFDLALLGGQWDTTLKFIEAGPLQLHLYAPVGLTLLGFSNTDFDEDRKLKHYMGVGAGPGLRASSTVVGELGFFVRGEGMGRSLNRYQRGQRNQVRHELMGELEAGVGLLGAASSVTLGVWAEVVSQWETRDTHQGVDRQYSAWGLRFSFLLNKEAEEPVDTTIPEDLRPETI